LLQGWLDKGNPNVKHYVTLLDTEWAALNGQRHVASKLYETSVTLAARGGFLQDAGLANERYADFLLRDVPDEDEAAHRMEEAIRFYGNWRAARKVDRLRVKLRQLSRLV
jgi:hypothetical protein